MNLDITCAVIGWKSVLYESIEHRADLKLSRHLPNCTVWPFPELFPSLFFYTWKWNFGIGKSANSIRTTKKKVCKHAKRHNRHYYYVSRDKNLQRENEMDCSPSFESFHTQLDCKLTNDNKNQTQLTLVWFIWFRVKKKRTTKQEWWKSIPKVA